jgi:acyl-coenzyme A thioesterase 13
VLVANVTCQNRLKILHGGTIASMVDLGGSLAVASHGVFNTGVSTDISVTYLANGGAVGEKIKASAVCDRSVYPCVLSP